MIVVASSRRQRVDHALASLESGAEGHLRMGDDFCSRDPRFTGHFWHLCIVQSRQIATSRPISTTWL